MTSLTNFAPDLQFLCLKHMMGPRNAEETRRESMRLQEAVGASLAKEVGMDAAMAAPKGEL